ncbi:hypothetical protein C8R48DRAFT_690195 [Suillus tomentosus]|nr:hypothetical protein C8R48DRAFT_690195 [Suillus tomentosus]
MFTHKPPFANAVVKCIYSQVKALTRRIVADNRLQVDLHPKISYPQDQAEGIMSVLLYRWCAQRNLSCNGR